MSGGRGKIHEHPNAGQNSFRHRPGDINRSGRPKSIYTIIREMGYTAQDIKEVFRELLFYTHNELKEAHEDQGKPIIVRIVANQLMQAFKKGDMGKIRELIDYTIGKPTQPTELNTEQ